VSVRRVKPLDLACPACGAEPRERCKRYISPNGVGGDGGRTHERRKAMCRWLNRELGWAPRKVPRNFREALR
jgi:hypothetical protein